MRKDNEIVSHPGGDRCSKLADRLLVVAEKERPAFVRAVEEIFGVEQACVSTMDWIEEPELINWPDGAAPPNWREVTIRASARLAAFRSEAATTIGTDKFGYCLGTNCECFWTRAGKPRVNKVCTINLSHLGVHPTATKAGASWNEPRN